jgi:hypothetical protein
MNERFKQLIKAAGGIGHDEDGQELTPMLVGSSLEKFAELIVQEMCSVLDKAQWDKGEDWICADGTRIIPQIKEHFGVEEWVK